MACPEVLPSGDEKKELGGLTVSGSGDGEREGDTQAK